MNNKYTLEEITLFEVVKDWENIVHLFKYVKNTKITLFYYGLLWIIFFPFILNRYFIYNYYYLISYIITILVYILNDINTCLLLNKRINDIEFTPEYIKYGKYTLDLNENTRRKFRNITLEWMDIYNIKVKI